jgi:hypothetical protein
MNRSINLVAGTSNSLNVRDLSRLQWTPLPAFVVSNTESHESNNSQVLASILLALLRLGLRGPVQELGNITGLLRDGGFSAILVLNTTVVKRRRHGDGTTWEVRVVMQTGHHFLSGRSLAVSSEESKDVIMTVVSGLDHQTQVRRVSTTVSSTSSLLVGVRGGNLIVRLSGAFKHFPNIVGSIQDVNILGHLLHFFGGVGDTDQLTESNVLERVARSTDLTVYLVTTSESSVVE